MPLEINIGGLDPAQPLTGAEQIPVVQAGTTVRTTVAAVNGAASGGVTNEGATAYSPILLDANGFKRMDNPLAIAVTIEPDATTNFAVGTTLAFEQAGLGEITYVQGAGVTINRDETRERKSNGRYSVQQLTKVAANVWTLYGNLKAA